MKVRLTVNGARHELEVEPSEMLNFVLRERLGLTGTKKGCDSGGCGACTVIVDGQPLYSCMTFAAKVDGADVRTIEGVSADGKLSPVQKAFVDHYALQCGYCTPGFIMSTVALLGSNPSPNEDEIKEALVGNLCRCTGYTKIVEAVSSLKEKRRETGRGRT